MEILKGDKYFVRIDARVEGSKVTAQDISDHMKYVNSLAARRLFVGGGYIDEPGGMCFFTAENLEDAHSSVQDDPLIKRGLYRYELHVWKARA